MALDDRVEAGVIARIGGEFRDMPRLWPAIDQACTLCGCDSVTWRHVDRLVAAGELRRSRDGRMIRARFADDVALR